MTNINSDAQAILLLTSHFKKPSKSDVEPLTVGEWGRFALRLKELDMQPGELLSCNIDGLLKDWQDSKYSAVRIKALLERGTALALAVEKWQRIGIWILVRTDEEYPSRLKERLKGLSPPVIYGCGKRKLLDNGGIAIVGSRNANENDLRFTKNLAEKIANSARTVISGGARGIDQAAMLGALEIEGTVVGVLADSLSRAVLSQKYRTAIQGKNLVLISPFYPDAGFNPGNAMARNKYIYCLSDGAIAIHSGTSGGTWSGATENLRKGWVPLWVKRTDDRVAGNAQIVGKGGLWLPDDIVESDLDQLLKPTERKQQEEREAKELACVSPIMETKPNYDAKPDDSSTILNQQETNNEMDTSTGKTLYEIFCLKLQNILAFNKSVELEGLEKQLGVTRNQLIVWLKQAIQDGLIVKKNKPSRYELTRKKSTEQLSLF